MNIKKFIAKFISDYKKERYMVRSAVAYKYGIDRTRIMNTAGKQWASFETKDMPVAGWPHYLEEKTWDNREAFFLLHGTRPSNLNNSEVNVEFRVIRRMTPYQWRQFGMKLMLPMPNQIMDIKHPVSVIARKYISYISHRYGI